MCIDYLKRDFIYYFIFSYLGQDIKDIKISKDEDETIRNNQSSLTTASLVTLSLSL